MAYDRHGITVATAVELTREESLDDAALERAEDDLVDLVLGYRPRPEHDLDGDPTERSRAFGRAVAWQAAHVAGLDRGDGPEPGTELSREAFPDYTADYADGKGPRGSRVSPHALAILTTSGLRTTSGYTTAGRASPLDPWRRA